MKNCHLGIGWPAVGLYLVHYPHYPPICLPPTPCCLGHFTNNVDSTPGAILSNYLMSTFIRRQIQCLFLDCLLVCCGVSANVGIALVFLMEFVFYKKKSWLNLLINFLPQIDILYDSLRIIKWFLFYIGYFMTHIFGVARKTLNLR